MSWATSATVQRVSLATAAVTGAIAAAILLVFLELKDLWLSAVFPV